MKRRTLDILFSTGGAVLAGLLLIVGIVMTSNANFARNYVADQLGNQHITAVQLAGVGEGAQHLRGAADASR